MDTTDFRALEQAKAIVDRAFGSEGTQWFSDELSDLHGASSALARTIGSLGQEAAIRAIARRIVLAATGHASESKIALAIIDDGEGLDYSAPLGAGSEVENAGVFDALRRYLDKVDGRISRSQWAKLAKVCLARAGLDETSCPQAWGELGALEAESA